MNRSVIPDGHFRLHTRRKGAPDTYTDHPTMHSALEAATDLYGEGRVNDIVMIENWLGGAVARTYEVRQVAARRWQWRLDDQEDEIEAILKEEAEGTPLWS